VSVGTEQEKTNSRDPAGVLALAIAASRQNAAICRSLLHGGADPNRTVFDALRGLFDDPILPSPAANGSLEVLDALLIAGADPDGHDCTGATPLMTAAYRGHEAIVARLIASGADLEAKDEEGQTALMFASNAGQLGVVRGLFSGGADVNARDKEGSTPLMFAAQHGHNDVVRHLLSAGADPHAVGSHGLSAIQFAEQNNCVETLGILLGGRR
jgi:ankyrin repeat protein